jgi:hypothetical protein
LTSVDYRRIAYQPPQLPPLTEQQFNRWHNHGVQETTNLAPLRSSGTSSQPVSHPYDPTGELHARCPTPPYLYELTSDNSLESYARRFPEPESSEVVQKLAESHICQAQETFRRFRFDHATRGPDALGYFRYFPQPPVIPIPKEEEARFSQPGIHILPSVVDRYGVVMPPRKVVAARAARPAAAPSTDGLTSSARRKEFQVIGGKETSVTILSDSEDPPMQTNGNGKPATASAPRRRAPPRAAAMAAAAAAANGLNGTAGGSGTRKRKVAEDDSASVTGPATKRVGKVNGKAGVGNFHIVAFRGRSTEDG